MGHAKITGAVDLIVSALEAVTPEAPAARVFRYAGTARGEMGHSVSGDRLFWIPPPSAIAIEEWGAATLVVRWDLRIRLRLDTSPLSADDAFTRAADDTVRILLAIAGIAESSLPTGVRGIVLPQTPLLYDLVEDDDVELVVPLTIVTEET